MVHCNTCTQEFSETSSESSIEFKSLEWNQCSQIIQEEDNNTQGSSSFSSWNHQIQIMKSQPRKRALGRVKKTLAAPQRMRDLDIKEENEENHSFGKPQRMKDMLDTKEENEENRSLGMPQRANPNHSKNVSFPMPQRANHSKNISISVTPASPSRLAQRSQSTPPPISRRSPFKIQKQQRQPQQPLQQLSQESQQSLLQPENHFQENFREVDFTKKPIVPSRRSPVEIIQQQQSQPHQQLSQQQIEPRQPISRQCPVERQQQQQQQQQQQFSQQPQQQLQPQYIRPQAKSVIVNGKSYLKGEKVGHGGSCVVYKGTDTETNQTRAIKIVDLSKVSDSEADNFRQEVKLIESLQALNSNRIIKLFDWEERPKTDDPDDGKELFVVMELGESDLASVLKLINKDTRGLTDAKTKFYWGEMLETVEVVHSKDIVHKDLKPANFLIVKGMLKIIDFGIASQVEDDKTHVTEINMMGTLNFMSPEAFPTTEGCGPRICPKADVWSLGCILYHMVYKKYPFGHIKQPIMKMQAIKEKPISFPDDAQSLGGHDPKVVDVLKCCLQRNVQKRASIDQLLKHPYLKGDTLEVKKVSGLANLIDSATPNTRRLLESLTKTSEKKPAAPNFDD